MNIDVQGRFELGIQGSASHGSMGASPSGMSFSIDSSYLGSIAAVMSDLMKPGATALQVMLRPAYSLATVFVNPNTPAWQCHQQ